jgi:hypothetical protein
VEALRLVAAQLADEGELTIVLHSFGHQPLAEAAAQGHDRPQQGLGRGVDADPL